MTNIDETLQQRGSTYGSFEDNADTTQALKRIIQTHPNYNQLRSFQKEAIDMTFHKIARIINGDPNYIDSWHDIIGYVSLVEKILIEEQTEKLS